jgi:hypothetical protein
MVKVQASFVSNSGIKPVLGVRKNAPKVNRSSLEGARGPLVRTRSSAAGQFESIPFVTRSSIGTSPPTCLSPNGGGCLGKSGASQA